MSLNALDERVPLRGAEDQGRSRRILGVTYCTVTFGKLRHLDTSGWAGLGRLDPGHCSKHRGGENSSHCYLHPFHSCSDLLRCAALYQLTYDTLLSVIVSFAALPTFIRDQFALASLAVTTTDAILQRSFGCSVCLRAAACCIPQVG